MRFVIFISLFLYTGFLQGQPDGSKIKRNGIYLSDSDFLKRHLTLGFDKEKGIKLNDNKRSAIWIKDDTLIHKFYYDDIWGYRKDGVDWRIYDNKFYQVEYVGKVCVYVLPGGAPMETSSTLHFSVSLAAPVHDLLRSNLIAAFHSNTSFIERIKKFPLTKSITKWDKISKCYLFITWL